MQTCKYMIVHVCLCMQCMHVVLTADIVVKPKFEACTIVLCCALMSKVVAHTI